MTNLEKIKTDIKDITAKDFAKKYEKQLDCPQCVYEGTFGCRFERCVEGHTKWLESEAGNESGN